MLLLEMGTQITDITSLDVVLLSGIGLLLHQIFRIAAKWFENEVMTGQEIRLKLKMVKLEAQRKKIEELATQEIEDMKDKAKNKLAETLLDDIIALNDILKRMRYKYDAKRVILFIFHNGIAKGFRNFSARYEVAREINDEVYDRLQSKPLGKFYKIIETFKKEDMIVYTHNETDNLDGYAIKGIDNEENSKTIFCPLLVHSSIYMPDHHKLMSITNGGEKYHIIGLITLTMDGHSEEIGETEKNDILRYSDDIINLYEKNYTIVG